MWTISILKPRYAFLKFHNLPVLFDYGSFCSKRNEENGTFLFDISGHEMFILKYHYNILYLVMYLAVKCEYMMNL